MKMTFPFQIRKHLEHINLVGGLRHNGHPEKMQEAISLNEGLCHPYKLPQSCDGDVACYSQ